MNWKRLSPQRERRLSEAVTTYIARRALREHPSGSFPTGPISDLNPWMDAF